MNTCDFCGKPFTKDNPAVPMDNLGSRMHARCGIRSESGEMPTLASSSGGGLWGFTSAPTPKDIAESLNKK